jgi:hypothetical protein
VRKIIPASKELATHDIPLLKSTLEKNDRIHFLPRGRGRQPTLFARVHGTATGTDNRLTVL